MKEALVDNKLALISTKHKQNKLLLSHVLAAVPLNVP
jgi:hypothetical protein